MHNVFITTYYKHRYNKYIKNLVRDVSHPEANLANSVTQDAATHFANLAASETFNIHQEPLHICVLSVPKTSWLPTKQEICDLRMLGCSVDQFSVRFFAVTHILGVHFRAGEWSKYPRCGSVVTCVIEGQSLYGRVTRFLRVDGDNCPGYAVLEWFGKPEYPYGTPLVVKVGDDGRDIDAQHGSIIKITQIDPSRVMFEYDRVPNTYYMMRDSGYDTILP